MDKLPNNYGKEITTLKNPVSLQVSPLEGCFSISQWFPLNILQLNSFPNKNP